MIRFYQERVVVLRIMFFKLVWHQLLIDMDVYPHVQFNNIINRYNNARVTTRDEQYICESVLLYLHYHERVLFCILYLLVYAIAFFGNISVVIATIHRKQRYVQKACVISLAISDFITASSNVVLHLSTFVNELKIWTLGSFMCSFLPLLPVFGTICSSAALVGIAYDRYVNVLHIYKNRWQPTENQCLIGCSMLWLFSAGVSYPMYTFFEITQVNAIDCDDVELYYEEVSLCLSPYKTEMMIYYISIMCILFIPMLLVYIWVYIKIAQLVWNHRKPVTETSVTSTSTNTTNCPLKNNVNERINRKLKTFKIIIFLMCTFLILRLPNLIFDTLKLSVTLKGHGPWITKYVCVFLTLLSCALNPFLYTFLGSTIEAVLKVKACFCGICCFGVSTQEFEDLQNANPFRRKSYKRASQQPKTKSSVACEENPNCQLQSTGKNQDCETTKY